MGERLLLSTNGAGNLGQDVVALAERQGWGIFTFGDSQIKAPDPFVRAAASVGTTDHIVLRISVTNPVTRDASVNASAAAALQMVSNGRAVLGIGAGYTSLGLIGIDYPVRFKQFATYLTQVRTYLHGGVVERGGVPSRLRWLAENSPPVPVDVTASGPRNIRLGAQVGDWLTLAVGAKHDNVSRAIELARASTVAARRDFDELMVGVHVPIAVSDSPSRACRGVRNTVATMAGFSVMATPSSEGLSEVSEDVASRLRERLAVVREDEERRKRDLDGWVSDDFVREFALCGTSDEVTERIASLRLLGVRYMNFVFGSDYADPSFVDDSYDQFVSEVLPHFSVTVR